MQLFSPWHLTHFSGLLLPGVAWPVGHCGVRHRQAVAIDAELRSFLEVAGRADALAAVDHDGAVQLVPALWVRHLEAVMTLRAEHLALVAALRH